MQSGYRLAAIIMATMALSVPLQPVAAEDKAAPAQESKSTDVRTVPAPWASIDERMVRIEHRLVDAVSSGRIGVQEASDIRKEVDGVAAMEVVFRALPANAITWHKIALNQELDRITDQMERSMHDRTISSPDLTFAKEDTLKRIDSGILDGRLTSTEATELKQEYNRILALEHLLRQTNGHLSYSDRLLPNIDLDHLGARIRRQMSDRVLTAPDVAKVKASLEKRIDDAIAGGRMEQSAATNLKNQLKELSDSVKGKDKLESKEMVATGLWLEMISNRIDEAVARTAKALPTPETLVRDLDKKLGVSLARGALTPLETLELKEDLDLLSSTVKKGYSNLDEETGLRLVLARFDGLLDRQIHPSTHLWPGIRAYQTHQQTRIKEGLAAKRLSDASAARLQATSDGIAKSIDEIRDKGNGYFSANALATTVALQQLSGEIDQALKDRTIEVPKTEALRSALDHRIGDTVVAGGLNVEEGRAAKHTLEEIERTADLYKASDSELTPRETLNLAYELEQLSEEVEEQVHAHSALFPGMDLRRTQIEELINEGCSSGRLSEAETKAQKEVLAKNLEQEKQYRNTTAGLTAAAGIELVASLEGQFDRLQRLLRERQVTSADMTAQIGKAERKIAQGACMGYLSLSEAQALRRQFDSLYETFSTMRGSAGGLSYGERVAFSYGFLRLSSQVERQLRSTPLPLPSIDGRRNEIEQKLADAMVAGKLPATEAFDLKSLTDEIWRNSRKQRMSGGGISYGEALVTTVDLDRLGQRVDRRIHAQKQLLPNIDQREDAIDKKIKDASSAGKLTAAQLESLKGDLDRLTESELAFRTSDEILNFAESAALEAQLSALEARLEQLLRNKQTAEVTSKSGIKPGAR